MELLVENHHWQTFRLELPGVEGSLLISSKPVAFPLPHTELAKIFGIDHRLNRFEGQSPVQYAAYVTLKYGSEEPDPADILRRVFAPVSGKRRGFNPRRFRHQQRQDGTIHLRHVYLFKQAVGELQSVTLPLEAIVNARQSLARDSERDGECVRINPNFSGGYQYLHYKQDGTLLFTRMPVLKKPGLALLLSKRVVNTIIASYALALVGPHREWLATLAKPPAP